MGPRALALALVGLVLAAPAVAQDAPAPAKPAWSVEDPGGPYRDLAFDATEGTWISVDCSPDGTRLAFDLLGDVWTMPIAGGDATCVADGLPWEHQPRWSPDGKRLLFTSDRGGGDNLWTMAADGSDRKALTSEEYRLFNNGNWHPSGRFIVGRKHFTSRRSLGAGEMWMLPFPEGGAGLQLTRRKNDQQDAGEPVFSPDGKRLYWSEDMSGGDRFQYNKDPHGVIYRVRRLDLETGEVRDLISMPGGSVRPQPSPDGKSLAFVRRAGNRSVLSLIDLETAAVRDLWDGLSLDQQETWAIFGPHPGYAWTPDGASIVISARGRIWRVAVADGKAAEIPVRAPVKQRLCETVRTPGSEGAPEFDVKVVRWPQVTPDGKTAVFQALGKVWVKALPDGEPRRLTQGDGADEFAPSLSPGGAWVQFCTWDDRAGGSLATALVDGTPGQGRLTDGPGHYLRVVGNAAGEHVVHRGGPDTYRGGRFADDAGLWFAPKGTARWRLLSREGRNPAFSADGQRVLFTTREGDRNALVSVNLLGGDRRVHATSERAVDFVLSPDGKWLAFEEAWQAWVCPFPGVNGAAPLAVGPDMKDWPVVRLSQDAGTYLSWSADSATVRWSLGPDLFEARVAELFPPAKKEADARRGVGAKPIRLGWTAKADAPATELWITGATVLPMDDLSAIDDAAVRVKGNRIEWVGPRAEASIPAGARVFDATGCTLMPGLVDVHSHHGSSEGGVHPRASWALHAMLAFGITTVHDPSNDTQGFYAESELVRAGRRLGPRMLSTGTILYGAEGERRAVVNSLDDALEAVRRTAAWGPRSVKSYNQPRRNQRQQVIRACRELGILCMPEGASTLSHNLTMLLDGHTTIEHALPVAPLFEPEMRLFAASGTCYTPTLVVGYGGLWGENFWYAKTKVHENERLMRFVPRTVVEPRSRRRVAAADDEDYNHFRLAATAAELHRRGVNVEIGAHGQLQGLGAHWETWMFAQGGMTPHEALRCASFGGARALCLDHELGSIRAGRLADLIVIDGDPRADIRGSENIRWTMVNGRLFDARTLAQLAPNPAPAPEGPPLDSMPGDDGHACD